MFTDRIDAAEKLSQQLTSYKNKERTIVMAIPRGGVGIGSVIADRLNLPFDIIIVRKLPLPYNRETGFGAVAEDGSVYMLDEAPYMLNDVDMRRIESEQAEEVQRRKKVLKEDRELPDLKQQTVILVDDGLAMGSTMKAAIRCCRFKGASQITVAVPVSGREVAKEIQELADDVIVLEEPENFRAVAQVYQHWYDVSDEEVVEILEKRHYFSRK